MIDLSTTLGDLVNEAPDSTRVLERFGLDYCCGGQRSLGEAIAEAGVDAAEVTAALEQQPASARAEWVDQPPAALAADIVATHHEFLWEELPRLSALGAKVLGAHGANHPELAQINEVYETLRAELEPHLTTEETVLFPAIAALAARKPALEFGAISNPVSSLMSEHDAAGELLLKLRELTNGYTAPEDGCASYRAYFAGLAAVESDTHLHIHKENNTLFPKVVELEKEKLGAPA